MKKKKLSNLTIKKETIVNLNNDSQLKARGGDTDTYTCHFDQCFSIVICTRASCKDAHCYHPQDSPLESNPPYLICFD